MHVQNQTWWGSLQEQGAAQFDTLSTKSAVLNFAQFRALWDDGANPMICTRASSFADIQKNIQIICSAYPSECLIDDVQSVQRFLARVARVKRHGYSWMMNPSAELNPTSF